MPVKPPLIFMSFIEKIQISFNDSIAEKKLRKLEDFVNQLLVNLTIFWPIRQILVNIWNLSKFISMTDLHVTLILKPFFIL